MSLARLLLAVAAIYLFALAAHANTFTVSTNADSGSGSLRQAIMDANAMIVSGSTSCAGHSIVFAIPGSGVHTIQPMLELPPLAIMITLDGYTQPGASVNTLDQGDNAQLRIELDGSRAGASHGIVIAPSIPGSGVCGGSSSLISGLAINRFALAAIYAEGVTCQLGFSCGVGGVHVYGNFIGTDVTGTIARGNGTGLEFGLHTSYIDVGDEIVGEGGSLQPLPLTRNLISGNALDGVHLSSVDASVPSVVHRIRNNYIGLNASGSATLPNGRHGVFADIGSSGVEIADNLISGHPGDGVNIADNVNGVSAGVSNNGIGVGIGGVALGNAGDGVHVSGASRGVTVAGRFPYLLSTGQLSIANNGGAGVYVEDAASVDVPGAAIGNNAGLGIDLAPRGVNPQDATQPDSGPNELLNAPVLTSLTFDPSTSAVSIDGTLNTTPNSSIYIYFYVNDACDPSGYGEGQTSLDFVHVTTDTGGNANFNYQTHLDAGFVTAMARRFATTPDDSSLIVSEYSACRRVGGDVIFVDGFGG